MAFISRSTDCEAPGLYFFREEAEDFRADFLPAGIGMFLHTWEAIDAARVVP
jgi:hypothetical protein